MDKNTLISKLENYYNLNGRCEIGDVQVNNCDDGDGEYFDVVSLDCHSDILGVELVNDDFYELSDLTYNELSMLCDDLGI